MPPSSGLKYPRGWYIRLYTVHRQQPASTARCQKGDYALELKSTSVAGLDRTVLNCKEHDDPTDQLSEDEKGSYFSTISLVGIRLYFYRFLVFHPCIKAGIIFVIFYELVYHRFLITISGDSILFVITSFCIRRWR